MVCHVLYELTDLYIRYRNSGAMINNCMSTHRYHDHDMHCNANKKLCCKKINKATIYSQC